MAKSRKWRESELVIVKGLVRLAEATRAELSDSTLEVYVEALLPRTTPEEFEAFTLTVAPRLRWFPKLVEILDALSEYRGEPSLEAEAVMAYERVIASSSYTPEGGASWNYRAVLEGCGKVAAEAFLAAGGHHAFATSWDEARRRERFVAEYLAGAREVPTGRLLPPREGQKLLASGEQQRGSDPPKAEAATILAQIARRAGH